VYTHDEEIKRLLQVAMRLRRYDPITLDSTEEEAQRNEVKLQEDCMEATK
jgi:hypothetical protein